MSAQRVALWATKPNLDNDINDVDIPLTVPTYPSADMFEDPNIHVNKVTQLAQQTALAQILNIVKCVSSILTLSWVQLINYRQFIIHFHQAVLDNNLPEITLTYESGWNRLTENFYARTKWLEAETIAPLVNDNQIFLILYWELYYHHVYLRLQPNINDSFHSYENSYELFNYLLSTWLTLWPCQFVAHHP